MESSINNHLLDLSSGRLISTEQISTMESASIMPTTAISENDETFVSDTAAIVMSVFLNIISVLGIIGNSIVIIAVVFSRKLQTATNVFVIALSATDLLVCLTLPFQTLALTSSNDWPLQDWICASIGGITSICFGASVLLLVLIAINRYCVITRHRSTCRRFYKAGNLALMVSSAYLYTVVMFAILPMAGIGQLGYSPAYRICAWNEMHELSEVNDYIVALTFGVSFVIIVVCYLRIYSFVRNHHRNILHHGQKEAGKFVENELTSVDQTDTQPTTPSGIDTTSARNVNSNISEGRKTSGIKKVVSKREVEITKNLFFVIVSFFLCIAPYSVSLALPNGASASIYTGILLMINACINPIIYSFKHPTFKVVIRCMVTCHYVDIPKPTPTLKKMLNLRKKTSSF